MSDMLIGGKTAMPLSVPTGRTPEVKKAAPGGFDYVDRVLSRAEREAIVKGYAGKAGFALAQVNK